MKSQAKYWKILLVLRNLKQKNMKKIALLFFLLIGLQTYIIAQKGIMSIDEGKKQKLFKDTLDKIYPSAVGDVYKGETKDFLEAYKKMYQKLSSFLKSKGLYMEKINVFSIIYFNDLGKLDYYLYNFNSPFDIEKQKIFQKYAYDFFENYTFEMPKNRKFTQCSPIQFNMIEEKK
ncbi:MAG: hypothetical protein EAZ06_01715 [Cytophagales bacterium]|nr:MAG: hypothetical protein EAY69_10340 [Cytophagales bacterium]TAH30883.1 MAG: hypothetical protein EAZ06_01715 [Cytophagales bacterium]